MHFEKKFLIFFQLFVLSVCLEIDMESEDFYTQMSTVQYTFPIKGLNNKMVTIEYFNITFIHAESPVWDPQNQILYWVDVTDQIIYEFDFKFHRYRAKSIGYGEVNVVIPVKDQNRLLVAVRSAIYLFDWRKPGDSSLRLVTTFDHGHPDNVINEAKADAHGRFWGGTKGMEGGSIAKYAATFYSAEAPHFEPRIKIKPVTISNGVVWSLNNTIMYYTDSQTRKIVAYQFNLNSGEIRDPRVILDLAEYDYASKVIPDGMTIDSEGFLWVALMYGGCVVRVDPVAKMIVQKFQFSTSQITSVTWGGPKFDILYVTTSQKDMTTQQLIEEPLAGVIFAVKGLNFTGVPSHKINFPNADLY